MSVKDKCGCGELYAIVAMGRGNEIGFRGDMPWHIPEDLRHFKELTLGHPVIMGRATWESLPKRPLPRRRNVVITGNPDYEAEGAETASGLDEALEMLRYEPEVPFIIGGGTVYADSIGRVSKVFVTRIDADFPDADTFFPSLEGFCRVEAQEPVLSKCGLTFRFETYESCNNKQE